MTVKDILKEREKTHGDYVEFTFLLNNLKESIREHSNYDNKTFLEKETIDMILFKLCRYINSNHNEDTLLDIQGYTQLLLDNSKKD